MIGIAARADGFAVPRLATPTGLRIAVAAIAGLVAVFAVLGTLTVAEQQRAADSVGLTAAPLLASAERLNVALAKADAAASTAYLAAGTESPELRDRYEAAMQEAGQRLAEVGTDASVAAAADDPLTLIHERLIEYAGLIERARANNRLGYEVGGAALREASEQMRNEILPAAIQIYRAAADAVDTGQRTGASADAVVVLGVGGGLLVVALVATQVFLGVRTRRIINVWLLGATVLTVVVGLVVADGLANQRDALARSRQHGSDPLMALSVARILALRSMNDENLFLIGYGTDHQYQEDFADMTERVAADDGLLAAAARGAVDAGAERRIDGLRDLHHEYLALHDQVDSLVDASYDDAVALAIGNQAAASAALDDALAAELETTRASLDRHAAAARGIGGSMIALIVIAGVGIVALSAIGVGIRLREYR